jgi:hypothetical protein
MPSCPSVLSPTSDAQPAPKNTRRNFIFKGVPEVQSAGFRFDANRKAPKIMSALERACPSLLLPSFRAYPLAGFDQEKHRKLFFNICGEHSQVNPAEGYPESDSEIQRRRKVAHLQ